MAEISISVEDFQKFREFFYRKTGIQFESSKRYFVDKRWSSGSRPPPAIPSAAISHCCAFRRRVRNCNSSPT
jgi:hypothetical protein